jgi:hypothetical protein
MLITRRTLLRTGSAAGLTLAAGGLATGLSLGADDFVVV